MDLYQLVQSMTKPERRYFRLYIKSGSNGQEPKYLSLFNVLCKVTSYDEKKIVKKGYTYHDRNLLMEKVLEALHVFHARKSVDAEIQMLLNQAAILYDKSIWDEMDRRLQKAKKLAIENERLLLLLQVTKMQEDLLDVLSPADLLIPLKEEELEVKQELMREMEYTYLFYEMSLVYEKDGILAKPESREQVRQLCSPPKLRDLSDSSTVIAKIYYHLLRWYYYRVLNDEEKITLHIKQVVQLIDKNSFVFSARPQPMIFYYFALIVRLEKTNQPFKENINIIEVIDKLPTSSHYHICFAYGFSLEYCTIKLNKKQGEMLIGKMNMESSIFKDQLNQNQLLIFYQIMIFYGTFNEWGKAQRWLYKIISIKRPGIRKNLKFKARFYSLIIYYELGADDLKTHLQSVQKYLQRNNKYTEIEKEIIQHIATVQEAIREKQKAVIWEKLYYFLEEVSTPMNNIHIPIAQLKQWCKSKMKSITIAEVIRRERQQ